jgi:DNA-binding SARP family transcriptional activator/ATP/maltotriose-dependent transcriptional regulator MalT
MIALRICLLGLPQILRAEESVTHCLSQKALGLLAYLVMGPSHGYTREKLAGLFWGETDEEHANFNLRRALWSLRKAINPPGTPSDTYICYEEGRYSFNRSSDHWLDVNAFEYAVNAYSRHRITTTLRPPSVSQLFTSPGLENLRGAMQLYRGGFLEGCSLRRCPDFIDWLFLERDRLKQQYIKGLRALAVESAIQSDYEQAITDYRQILSADPLNEATHRDLMVVYYTLGKRDKAVEQYRSFCRVLRQQLDLEPLPETQSLYLDIRNGTLTVESPSYWLTLAQKITTQVAPSGPFVGREPEQIKLSEALESAMQGSGCLAVINGEAGVGKTRLIEEFLRRISRFPLIILRARCYAQEQGLPYQPIIDALRDYLSIADFTHIKCLSNLWLAEVAKLLPEIHNHLPHLPISPVLFPDQERNRLFEGLAQFITHLSQREPLILFLDDFHAADEPTFDLIHYLARRLASGRVLIICALRQEALADRPSLTDLLRELDHGGRLLTIPLVRLSETEVLELIRRTLGTPVELEKLGHRLYLETGGNPFFLVEMLKAHQEGQGVSPGESTVPSSVRDVIQRRLGRLDDKGRRVLTMAAIIGRQFHSTTLQQVYAGGEQDLLNVLDRLLSRGWIVELPGANPGTYDFSHGLVREAVYQTLRADWRRRLHRQVGLVLESTTGDRDEWAGVLAHHFWKAGDADKALHYSLQAAARAQRLYANRETIIHYQRALEIAEQSDAVLSAAEWLELQCQLGQAYEFLGKYDAAIAVYKAALLTFDLSKPNHRRICFQLAIACDRKGEYDQALDCLRAIGTHLSEPKDLANKLEAAMIARGTAMVYLHREQSHQALAFCRQALALIGSDAGNDEGMSLANQVTAERVAVYEIMGDGYFHLGNYEAAVSHYQQALEIAQQQDWRPTISRLLLGLGKVARRRGDYAQAGTYAQQSLDLCREIGHIAGEAASLGILGDVAYNRGDFEQAISCYDQALSTFRQIGDQHSIADYCLSLAFVKIDQREIDEAEDYLQEALTIGQGINAALVLIRAQYHLAKVARARGHLDEAQAEVEQAIEAAQRTGIRLLEAMGRRLLGEILAQRRQPAQAEVHMIESLRLLESLGDRFETAWALRSYARLLADRGDLSHAGAQLQRANAIFAELGAQRELTRTNAELARLQRRQK